RRSSFSADNACLPGDKWWSNFHQSSPICSALSIEQMSNRIRIVRSSTSASDTLISPATTNPLSRTRSRTSTSPVDRPWPSVSDVGIGSVFYEHSVALTEVGELRDAGSAYLSNGDANS